MALGAASAGALAAIGGLIASLTWDTPAGPSIVVVATALFAAGLVVVAVVPPYEIRRRLSETPRHFRQTPSLRRTTGDQGIPFRESSFL